MRYLILIFAALLWSCGASVAPKSYADYSSSLGFVATDSVHVENLVVLARVWGLAKYHHPAFADSIYNADYELFELLPQVAYAVPEERNRVLADWIDGLGEFRSDEKRLKRRIERKSDYSPTDWTWLEDPNLGAELSEKLQSVRWAKRYKPSRYAKLAKEYGQADFREESKGGPFLSDTGYTLLTLFRLWNMAQYYFPNVDITNKKWADVLPEYVPKFLRTNDIDLTTAEFIAELSDSHSQMNRNSIYTNSMIPVELGFVENKLIVTNNRRVSAPNEKSQFKLGDEIISIGGRTPEYFVERARKYIAASNENVLLRDAAENAVMTSDSTTHETLVIKRDSMQLKIRVQTIPGAKYIRRRDDWMNKNHPYHELLSDSIGYLYPAKLKNEDINQIKKQFSNTKAVIVDLRCYPTVDFYKSIDYFFPHATHHVTWRKPTAELPGYFEIIPYKIGKINRNNYRGRVVVLANEQTQSRAEYMTMALQSLSSTIVVGSQTAGSDGDIVVIPLPREIITLFSGLGVYYPDGTNTQRTGIRIDHYVTPTINGIRAGRDEVLEKAMEIIESSH